MKLNFGKLPATVLFYRCSKQFFKYSICSYSSAQSRGGCVHESDNSYFTVSSFLAV